MWGSYTLGKLLGKGEYAEVRVGKKDGQSYAIKKFTKVSNYGIESPQEIALTLQSSHPHIIKGEGYFLWQGEQYLVTELADCDLLTHIRENKPTEEEVLRLFQQLASALAYLQENGFYHCDLKPENVLLKQGQVKLADFGLSGYKSIRPDSCNSFTSPQDYYLNRRIPRRRLEERHVNIFTQKVDYQSSDIWALGMMFVYMLTGKVLFYEKENTLEEYNKFLDDAHVYLVDYGLEERWFAVTDQMLHPDQTKRIRQAREVLDLLSLPYIPGSAPIFYHLDISIIKDAKISIVAYWLEEVFREVNMTEFDMTAIIACFYHVYNDLTNKGQERKIIQCLACACFLLMNKTYSSSIVNPEDILYFAGNTFTKEQLYEQERRVMDKLQGRVFFHTLATLSPSKSVLNKAWGNILYDSALYSTTNLPEYLDNLSV
ncbi:Serine/Threonine protein kinase [Brazilian cedratvirus IHUMI]|uniref:Serine/Threonine protein kinase n=1 Tax=Brazilian cedratvirus IHUMI TaxID=2126980 RepID=A0A2R8FDC8_9VIRU|nr:Serine/Threonine protein kinase [Brazilian cedratvirus IHUMI]